MVGADEGSGVVREHTFGRGDRTKILVSTMETLRAGIRYGDSCGLAELELSRADRLDVGHGVSQLRLLHPGGSPSVIASQEDAIQRSAAENGL